MKAEERMKDTLMDALPDDVPEISGRIKAIYLEREEAKRKKRKKTSVFFGIGIPVLAASVAMAVLLPPLISGGTPTNSESAGGTGGGGGGSLVNVDLAPKHEEIAFGVLSGSNFLSALEGEAPMMPRLMKRRAPASLLEERLLDVNPFMLTAETMLSSDYEIVPSKITYTEGEEFPYQMVIDEEEREIVFHYAETLTDQDDEEQEFAIRGYYEIDGQKYEVTGKREASVSGNESEYETEFKINIDESHYLVIETQNELEQTESEVSYGYDYYENGRPVLEVSLSYEREGLEEEMELEVETPGHEAKYLMDLIDQNTLTLDYEFEVETHEDEGEYAGQLRVTVSEDQASYIYTEGDFSLTLPRL